MDYIKILESLEPVFVKAGELACEMQKTAKQYSKFNSGNPLADIVTEADLAVQELLLDAMSKTELVNCKLMGEEKTPLTEKFTGTENFYISIDPIDGTKIYAAGGKCFSQIISFHDGEKFLYMYVRYPRWDWTLKIINGVCQISGATPDFNLPAEAKKSIVYWTKNPEQELPKDVVNDLKGRGLQFTKMSELGDDVSSIIMLSTNQIAGVCDVDPNVYDGLTEYNIGLSKGLKILSSGMNLSRIEKRETGLYYPGYCVELNNNP